jgi:hypothetical protein
MWNKNKIINEIEFIALDKHAFEICPKPFPASQALPQWWKDASPYVKSEKNLDGKKIIVENFESNASFKKCTPMLDLLSSGYIVPLWADVQVRIENGYPLMDYIDNKTTFYLGVIDSETKRDFYKRAKLNTRAPIEGSWCGKIGK